MRAECQQSSANETVSNSELYGVGVEKNVFSAGKLAISWKR